MAWRSQLTSILVVTDHNTHYPHESVYPICRALSRKRGVDRVNIVSRGVRSNSDFFRGDSRMFLAQRTGEHFRVGAWDWTADLIPCRIDEFDTTFLRIDRPFDAEFAIGMKRSLGGCSHVLNNIDGILKTKLKSFVAEFDQFTPPSRICSNVDEINDFASEYDDLVIKPDDGYAAKGVVRLQRGKVHGPDFVGSFSEYSLSVLVGGPWPRVAVRFLPRISEGDKRLLIANGKLVSSVLRVPHPGNWLVNYTAGRIVLPSWPTQRETEIIDYVSEKMKGLGVFIYSIDTIEDDDGQRLISEINSLNAGLLSFSLGENQDVDAEVVARELLRVASHS